MSWQLRETSGPYPAPWEGRDAVGWVWEVYGEGEESRRVLVEVSGTAMAVAPEYLPEETRLARETSGRSEVEKVLELEDPPRRVTLGTTGVAVFLGVTRGACPARERLFADPGHRALTVAASADTESAQISS